MSFAFPLNSSIQSTLGSFGFSNETLFKMQETVEEDT